MRDPGDLRGAPLKPEDSRRDEDRRTTETVWSAAGRDPGTVHTLKEPRCKADHLFEFLPELQPVTETANKQAGVDQRDLQEKPLDETHVDVTQMVHVGLDGVREINQQVRGAAVTTTRCIEANCGHNRD